MANFRSSFPRRKRLKFVTENFTTFFTARKEICHLELTLGPSLPKKVCPFPAAPWGELEHMAFRRKGREFPRQIRTEKCMFYVQEGTNHRPPPQRDFRSKRGILTGGGAVIARALATSNMCTTSRFALVMFIMAFAGVVLRTQV